MPQVQPKVEDYDERRFKRMEPKALGIRMKFPFFFNEPSKFCGEIGDNQTRQWWKKKTETQIRSDLGILRRCYLSEESARIHRSYFKLCWIRGWVWVSFKKLSPLSRSQERFFFFSPIPQTRLLVKLSSPFFHASLECPWLVTG